MKLPSLNKPSLAALSLLALAGMSHSALAAPPPLDSTASTNGPGADFPVVLGEQYSVGSTVYTPADVMNYDAVGYAAVVADGGGAVSAAHHTLPLPSYVEVTSLDSGRTILVRVDRRGPTDSNRVIALSPGAAAQLGLSDGGTVRVRRVNPPEMERAALRAGVTAPERMATPQPLLVVLKRRLGPDEPVSLTTTPAAVAAQMPASVPVMARAPVAVRPVAPQVYAPVRPAPAPVAQQPEVALPAAPAPVPFHSYLIRPLRRFPDGSIDNAPNTPAYSGAGDLASPTGAAPAPAYAPTPAYTPPPQQQAPRSYLIRPPAHPVAQPEQSATDGVAPRPAPARAKPKPPKPKPKPKPVHHTAPLHDAADAAVIPPAMIAQAPTAGGGMLVVQAGAFSVRGRAEEVAARIGGQASMSGRVWRVRSGPYASHAEAEAALAKAKAAGYSEARIQRAD
jgi:rare lipoprotein A